MRAYFPSQADSPYYNSEMFKQALDYLKPNFGTCEMIEKKGKEKTFNAGIKNINSIEAALRKNLQGNYSVKTGYKKATH